MSVAVNNLAAIPEKVRTIREEPRSDLFSVGGVVLPQLLSPKLEQRIQLYFSAVSMSNTELLRFLLVFDSTDVIALSDFQLRLPLSEPIPPSLVRLAPKYRHAYLDYGVYDTFRDLPRLAGAALNIENRGVYVLGQLVQMSEEKVRAFPFMSDTILADMKKHLAIIDFGFGMRIPSWNEKVRGLVALNL
jgi:hypothetical protein